MPTNALSPVPRTYAALRAAVETTMVKGQWEADLAKVRTYHETGRLIHEHVLLFKERAGHGSKTIARLSADVQVDRSILQRCVQFFRFFPNCATWRNLTWAHYRALIPIGDPKLRRTLATEADKNEWPVARLEQRIRTLLPPEPEEIPPVEIAGAPPKLLTPKRGTPGVCKVINAGDGPVVDLGFACYLDLPPGTDYQSGEFVKLDTAGRIYAAPDATRADLFTYTAVVLKVVDGDTLWVKVYLRPGQWMKQKLRLRDLDCPESGAPEGRAAKRFVEDLFSVTKSVTICTTKPDKYDRYLADVFLETKDGDIFLNNALLAHGHAVRMNEYSPADWDGVEN